VPPISLREIPAADFDLARTLDSGQVFHWEKCGAGFVGAIGDLPVYAEQRGETLRVRVGKVASPSSRSADEHGQDAHATKLLIRHYFALDHPLAEICRSFPDDQAMCAARDFCEGLRIIRQPRWECLATFITSSMKQVAHIRQMSRTLRERYGTPARVAECEIHTFPSANRIAELGEQDLRACALGYRAKNLLATARLVSSGEADLEGWNELPDEKLRARLCELPGVGAKVANCVMLFAYERLRAFPIDVWIERVLKQKYFPTKQKVTAQQLRSFCETHFGEHGGYAQQYLFHHARKGGIAPRAAPK
jgi:N-glycosylase/DNA lyase